MDVITVEANRMVDCLTSGQIADIASLYKYPSAVYFGDDVIVFNDAEELIFALEAYRAILMRRGLAVVETALLDAPDVEQDRFSVTVGNRYLDGSGQQFGSSKIRYYLQREENNCLKIRLVEYLDWPCKKEIRHDRTFALMRDCRMSRNMFSQSKPVERQSLH